MYSILSSSPPSLMSWSYALLSSAAAAVVVVVVAAAAAAPVSITSPIREMQAFSRLEVWGPSLPRKIHLQLSLSFSLSFPEYSTMSS